MLRYIQMDFRFRVIVRGLIIHPHTNNVLAVQAKRNTGYWALPGGGIQEGETLLQGLTREIEEETGITPQIGRLVYIQQYQEEGLYRFPEFIFLVNNYQDFENVDYTKSKLGAVELKAMKFIDPATQNLKPDFVRQDLIKQVIPTQTIFQIN